MRTSSARRYAHDAVLTTGRHHAYRVNRLPGGFQAASSHLRDAVRGHLLSTGSCAQTAGIEGLVDYTERLRRLAVNDDALTTDDLHDSPLGQLDLDPKTLALARVAALVAMGASEPSFGSQVDAAISAGATASEIVDTLVGVIAVVGVPRTVAAAPKIAMALGHDPYDEDTGKVTATGHI